MKVKYCVFNFAVWLLLSSCNNEEQIGITNDFTNPYEFVGIYHNKALLCILNELKESKENITRSGNIEFSTETVELMVNRFIHKNPLIDEINGFTYPCVNFSNQTLIPINDNFTRASQTQTGLTESMKKYISLFRELLDKSETIRTIEDFHSKMKAIEYEIFQSEMSEKEKAIMLVSYSVGRNSLEFWSSLHCEKNIPLIKTRGEGIFDWWIENVTPAITAIVESDFQGAISGAVIGAIDGGTAGTAVFPGGGTVTGGVGGAIVGGASGAIYGSVLGGIYYFTL